MTCRSKKPTYDNVLQWCNDNYFTNGILTLTAEEMAYIIHNFNVTYGLHASKNPKTVGQRAKAKKRKRVE